MEIITQTWPWYVAGPLISLVLFTLLYWGKTFGISGNYRTMCAILGGGKNVKFFDFDWRKEKWNLVFIFGVLIGAALTHWFIPNTSVQISEATIADLSSIGVTVGNEMMPMEIFAWENFFSLRSLVFIGLGGFLVGFGTRYAGGCTSGHAITGLSDLQIPSLIAVIGFFIGGLFITYLILPYLMAL